MFTVSCMEHILHLLESATSEIYSQATPPNIVLTAYERWVVIIPAYDVHVIAINLHNFRPSKERLIFPFEIVFLRLTLLADGEFSPDAPIKQSDVR